MTATTYVKHPNSNVISRRHNRKASLHRMPPHRTHNIHRYFRASPSPAAASVPTTAAAPRHSRPLSSRAPKMPDDAASSDALTLAAMPTLSDLYARRRLTQPPREGAAPPRRDLNDRVTLVQHDITRLRVGAIVNAANTSTSAPRARTRTRALLVRSSKTRLC